MRAAIYFYGQIQFITVKIDDELTDWFLTVEIKSQHLFAAKSFPKNDLTKSAIVSQLPCQFF